MKKILFPSIVGISLLISGFVGLKSVHADSTTPAWCKPSNGVSIQLEKSSGYLNTPISFCVRNDSNGDIRNIHDFVYFSDSTGKEAFRVSDALSPENRGGPGNIYLNAHQQLIYNNITLQHYCFYDPNCANITPPFNPGKYVVHILPYYDILTNKLVENDQTVEFTLLPLPVTHPYIKLSSYNGKPGVPVTLNGFDFPRDKQVCFRISTSQNPIGMPQGTPFSQCINPSDNGNFQVNGLATQTPGINTIFADSADLHLSLPFTVADYNPSVQPSSYYVLRGNYINSKGQGFAPNERIELRDNNTLVGNITADSIGSFVSNNYDLIPYWYKDSTLQQSFYGTVSQKTVNLKISVGDYYPQITPSSYYLKKGEPISLKGSNFAPNERIVPILNGRYFDDGYFSDSQGNVNIQSLPTPLNVKSINLIVYGLSTEKTISKIITLY